MPRIITWWSTSGASNLANLGVRISYPIFTTSSYLFSYDRPPFSTSVHSPIICCMSKGLRISGGRTRELARGDGRPLHSLDGPA
jgi:hypothetical protein